MSGQTEDRGRAVSLRSAPTGATPDRALPHELDRAIAKFRAAVEAAEILAEVDPSWRFELRLAREIRDRLIRERARS
jgi:hypothetical protein